MNCWENPFVMESKVSDIISQQARHGCNFNKTRASWYVHAISERVLNLDIKLIPQLPMQVHTNNKNHYKRPFKKSGQFMNYVQVYADKVGLLREEVGGPFSPVWYTPFDPSKTSALKDTMLGKGWQPSEWNEKKMPFDARSTRKLARGCNNYQNFLFKLNNNDREVISGIVEAYIIKHFKDKPVAYMKTVLKALGFNPNKPPTFDTMKLELVKKQYWVTSPKFTDDSDDETGERDEVLAMLLERMQWSHRRSLLEGLIAKVRPDGKLEGQANPCATPTARMKHRIIVNIPSSGALFGHQLRNLFHGDNNEGSKPSVMKHPVEKGHRVKPLANIIQEYNKKKDKWEDVGPHKILIPENQDLFVGGDGAGLELRMLTHYLVWVCKKRIEEAGSERERAYYSDALDSAYTYRETLLEGDIHSHNQRLAGLPTRADAKRFIYAFLM